MSGIRANHSHGDADLLASDRLDALWDDLVQTGTADLTAATAGDAARLSLISYAGHLVPRSDPAARERIRRRVFADYSEGSMRTASNVLTVSGSAGHTHSNLPRPWTAQPKHRPWWRGSIGLLELAITAALVLVTIGGITLLRPNDEPRSLPAAGSPDLGLGSPGAENSDIASEDLLTLKLTGSPNTGYSILLARVTLQPGAWWDFPSDPVAEVSKPFDHLVESGTLVLGVGEIQHTSESGDSFDLDGPPSYVKNAGQTPVTFLMAVAFTTDRMVLESPSGATIRQLGNVPIPAIAGNHEVAVHLTRSTLQPHSGATLPAAPKMSTSFVAVESGTLLARTIPDALVRSGEFGPDVVGSPEPAEFTEAPEDGIHVGAGETLTLDRTFVITDSAIVGDEPVEVLSLSYTVEDDAQLAETTAPNEVVWSIPSESNRVSLQMYKVALASDATLNQPIDGVAIIRVLAGTIAITQNADDGPHQLGPDDSIAYSGQTQLVAETSGEGPAVLILGFAFPTGAESPVLGQSIESNFAWTPLGEGEVDLPPGDARLLLTTETVSPDPSNSLVGFQTNEAKLIGVISGAVDVVRYGGQVVVAKADAADSVPDGPEQEYPFGLKATASEGDAIVAQPRSAYSLTTHGDEAPTLARLSISSESTIDISAPGPRGDEPISFGPDPCQVDPRPADDLRRLVESTENAELYPGLRDDASTGTPADATTANDITATVRDALACSRFGTPLQGYTYFTENALLAGVVANGLTLEEIDAMEQATPEEYPDEFVGTFSIDEIILFPDGRAGAWIFNQGELAYLTFIADPETGRWLIDAWDDRERA